MKKILIIAALFLACFAAGGVIGKLIGEIMNKSDKAGLLQRPQVEIVDGVMTPEALLSFARLGDPQISPDGKTIIYGLGFVSVEQNRICTNLFACNADGSGSRQLTFSDKSISCARWSPDGKSISYLQGGQLYRAPFKGDRLGRGKQLSDVPAGISDYSISPDGNLIYYVSSIPGPVTSPKDADPALDKAQAYVTEDLMYRHWDHWTKETPRTFVSTLSNGKITPDNSFDILGSAPAGVELPTEPFGGAEQLCWAPDSRHIAFSCRMKKGLEYAFSTNSCIYLYDILTGQTVPVTTEGGYDTDPSFSPDGSRLAWISMERDGYEADRQRLMLCDVEILPAEEEGQNFGMRTGPARELTEGFIYDAASIAWSPDSKTIVFPATTDGLGALYSSSLTPGSIKRLTPADWMMGFSAPFSVQSSADGGLSLLAGANSMDFPTELFRIDVPSDASKAVERTQITQENAAILEQLSAVRTEMIEIPTPQGETLHCWVLYPDGFDPEGSYNGIEMFNGGPQTSMDESWSYRWNFRLMCQQGYVVVLPCRHGDSGWGQPWKEQISGDYQGLNMQDYMLAGKWFKSQKWAAKLAGVGASYGGFSVYNLMGIHGDLFDCFIAHAGIFDEKMLWYTTEEAWFGNWDNGGMTPYEYNPGSVGPEGDGITFGGMQQAGAPYSSREKARAHYSCDPQSRVTKWHTPILCIHGMMDYRIPYEQGMAAFNAARMMGVPAKLIVFPEENHWILKPQNALFWHRSFFEWLDRWMGFDENNR